MWNHAPEPVEASYYRIENGDVHCELCSHRCCVREGEYGICQVRQNIDGKLYTHVYGSTISQAVDPVEKKPLYHFLPGSKSYSIATQGCNFRCDWCQNWQISQMPRESRAAAGRKASPEQIARAAAASGCESIAYTYTEPTIFAEYAVETSRLAHELGIRNIFVTNGYMTDTFLEAYAPLLDAANVDLKAFDDRTYKRYVGARLQPVLDSMKWMKEHGVWLEVTTLVIPGINDSPQELRDCARFVARELGVETPWHISRFHPGYRMQDRPPTPLETVLRAAEIGHEEGLQHVYVGNVYELSSQNTVCSECGKVLLQRMGFRLVQNNLVNGCCPQCGTAPAGVFQ